MKRLFYLLTAVILAAGILSGCGGSSSQAATVSMYDLRTAMEAADPDLPDMTSVSTSDSNAEDDFAYLADFDYSKVDSYFLSYSSEGKADEIAVIAVKDTKDISDVKQALEDHLDGRKKLYKDYDPEQLARTEDAEVFTQDQYAVLIIGDHVSDVKAAFEDFVKQAA